MVMWESFNERLRKNFKILLAGVAGSEGRSDCEDMLLEAMLQQGFRFVEIGIVDPENITERSKEGAVEVAATHISQFVADRTRGEVQPFMSRFVMRMEDDFMIRSGRRRGSGLNPGEGHFDLCTYSSGEREKIVSVKSIDRAAQLGLVIHACSREDSHQAEAYFYLPFEINQRFQIVQENGRDNVESRWSWTILMYHIAFGTEHIYIGDPGSSQAAVFGSPPNPVRPDEYPCKFNTRSGVLLRRYNELWFAGDLQAIRRDRNLMHYHQMFGRS